jgi:hypothetical protein
MPVSVLSPQVLLTQPTLSFPDEKEYDPATNTTVTNVTKKAETGYVNDPNVSFFPVYTHNFLAGTF